jgi:hypothetical protein
MGAVRVGFLQSQIDEPVKLAAIPIHMNHVLKIRETATGSLNRPICRTPIVRSRSVKANETDGFGNL